MLRFASLRQYAALVWNYQENKTIKLFPIELFFAVFIDDDLPDALKTMTTNFRFSIFAIIHDTQILSVRLMATFIEIKYNCIYLLVFIISL